MYSKNTDNSIPHLARLISLAADPMHSLSSSLAFPCSTQSYMLTTFVWLAATLFRSLPPSIARYPMQMLPCRRQLKRTALTVTDKINNHRKKIQAPYLTTQSMLT